MGMKDRVIKIYPYLLIIIVAIIASQYLSNNPDRDTAATVSESKTISDESNYKHRLPVGTDLYLPDQEFMTNFSYGVRLYDSTGSFIKEDILPSDTWPVQFFISMVNATELDETFGIMIFVDGILQNFRVDNSTETNSLYTLDMKKRSVVNIPVSMDETYLSEIDGKMSHNLSIVTLYNMKEFPVDMDEYHNVFAGSFSKKIKISIDKSQLVPTEPFRFETTSLLNETRNMNGAGLFFQKLDEPMKYTAHPVLSYSGQEVEIRLSGEASPGKYSTVVLINNKPISILDHDQLIWEWENRQEMFSFTLDITPYLEKEKNIIYAFTQDLENTQLIYVSPIQVIQLDHPSESDLPQSYQ